MSRRRPFTLSTVHHVVDAQEAARHECVLLEYSVIAVSSRRLSGTKISPRYCVTANADSESFNSNEHIYTAQSRSLMLASS